MSLDVYIKNKKKEEDREWVANITHNMNKMAQRIFVSENKETLYDYVWRPEELYKEIYTNRKTDGGLMIHFLSFLSNTKRRVKIIRVI